MANGSAYPGMPRWVGVSAVVMVIVIALVLLVLVTGAGGEHGPGRNSGGHTSATSVPADHTPAAGH